MSSTYRNIARVVKPHGKHGEVIVLPVRGLPFLLERGMKVALTPPAIGRDRFCTVIGTSDTGIEWRVRFSGIDSIDDAESVRGCYVLADAEAVELDALEESWEALIGRTVMDERYGDLGVVAGIIETPANDVLEVEGPYGEVLIPLVEEAVSKLDETGSVFTHIMDGLIDPSRVCDCGHAGKGEKA